MLKNCYPIWKARITALESELPAGKDDIIIRNLRPEKSKEKIKK